VHSRCRGGLGNKTQSNGGFVERHPYAAGLRLDELLCGGSVGGGHGKATAPGAGVEGEDTVVGGLPGDRSVGASFTAVRALITVSFIAPGPQGHTLQHRACMPNRCFVLFVWSNALSSLTHKIFLAPKNAQS